MKYNVGDKVKIRKDLEEGLHYGGIVFGYSMNKYKGKTLTISECLEGYYHILEDGEEDWTWTDEMFEEEPTIKDSGDRTEFKTGAVRDMRIGKGRCDLMPLTEIGSIIEGCGDFAAWTYSSKEQAVGSIFDNLDHFLFGDGGMSSLCYAAVKFIRIAYSEPYTAILELAKHFEDGAKKYGEHNWRKGIPEKCYIDSAVRHLLKWARGDEDEHHDRAFLWNVVCCMWTYSNIAIGGGEE